MPMTLEGSKLVSCLGWILGLGCQNAFNYKDFLQIQGSGKAWQLSCVGRTPPPSNSGPSPYHFFVTRRSVRLCRDALPLSFFCFFFLGVLGLFSNGNQVSQNIATRKHYPASQILLHDAECKCTVLLEDLNIWLKKHGQVPVDVHMCNVTPVSCIYDVYIYIYVYIRTNMCVCIYIHTIIHTQSAACVCCGPEPYIPSSALISLQH